MQYLNKFENFSGSRNFNNTQPQEITLMSHQEIIDLICNTFDSTIVSNDPEATIIKSEWTPLTNDNESLSIWTRGLVHKNYTIYFHIRYDDFAIIRGNSDELDKFKEIAQNTDPRVQISKTDKSAFLRPQTVSLILTGKMFPIIFYALAPIPSKSEFIRTDGELVSLQGFCGRDIVMRNNIPGFENLSYLSDLLIGQTIEIMRGGGEEAFFSR